MTAYTQSYKYSYYKQGLSLCDVTGTQVAWLYPLFRESDSSLVKLRLLGSSGVTNRTGYNSQNTHRVEGVGPVDQAPSLLKADGAGSMTPKRSRQQGSDYFRVTGGLS